MNSKKTKIKNIIYILIYSILIISVGIFHEPWSDEAQSWLIARDANFHDIFFKYTSYEGCFPLWICMLKMFIILGGKYRYIHIISSIITIISAYLIISNQKIKKEFRYLIPLNFWFFYQYGIISRNYSLITLSFSLFLLLYEDRHNKKIKYTILLIFISMINMYGMIISGILFLQLCIENFKKKNLLSLYYIPIVITYIFEIFVLMPQKDLLIYFYYQSGTLQIFCNLFLRIITCQNNILIQSCNLITVVLIVSIIISLKKYNKINIFSFMEFSILIFFLLVRGTSHHFGILFFIIIADLIFNTPKITNIKEKHIVETITTIILIIYTLLSIKSSIDDIFKDYSGAYNMSRYISENNIQNNEIFAIGYKCTAVLPYFDENIFCNRNTTFYTWDYSNNDNKLYNALDVIEILTDMFNDSPKYILLQQQNLSNTFNSCFKDVIDDSNLYEIIYETDGQNFFKGTYNEDEGFILYRLK